MHKNLKKRLEKTLDKHLKKSLGDEEEDPEQVEPEEYSITKKSQDFFANIELLGGTNGGLY